MPLPSAFSDNPLGEDSQQSWDELINRVDVASILVAIQSCLGPRVKRWHTAEDVWQGVGSRFGREEDTNR
jgi:hypothetical protein